MLQGEGSPGLKNPDALRYDPGGGRNTMTTNWAALQAGLAAARPNHLTSPSWSKGPGAVEAEARAARLSQQGLLSLGVPKDARRRGWDYTHLTKY